MRLLGGIWELATLFAIMAKSKRGGCLRCAERDQRLAALELRNVGLESQLAASELRNAELEAQLAKAQKNSRNSSIRKYFRDMIKIPISHGMLSKLIRKVSKSLQDPYEELLQVLADEDQLKVSATTSAGRSARKWSTCGRRRT